MGVRRGVGRGEEKRMRVRRGVGYRRGGSKDGAKQE